MQSSAKKLFSLPSKMPQRKIISVDIGGTLAKMAFYVPKDHKILQSGQNIEDSLGPDVLPIEMQNGDTIYLKSFMSNEIDSIISFIKDNDLVDSSIHATGGGAYKYQDVFAKEFPDVVLHKHDEMESLVNGMSFILDNAKKPAYTQQEEQAKENVDISEACFPRLLVSIGSGVSIIKVNDYSEYNRVGGTMIGGGTLLGLANLMTGVKDFNSICEMAKQGDNSTVDMLVKDIYGDKSPYFDLQSDILASSFGKVAFTNHFDDDMKLRAHTPNKKEDILNSLVFMISFNIGQLATLTAQLHEVKDIYFVGNYVKENVLAMERISFAIKFMSGGERRGLFMNYDGFLGAIGAFMKEFRSEL